MFQESVIEATARTHRVWTVLVSSTLQCTLVCGVLLIQLLRPELLPRTLLQTMLAVPPMPPPPPAPANHAPTQPRIAQRQFNGATLLQPARIPDAVAIVNDADLPVSTPGVPGGIQSGVPGGTGVATDSFFSSLSATTAPPPPVAKSEPAAVPTRLRLGGNILQGKLIYGPKPAYPILAVRARLEGTVQFTAIIGRDGAVQSLTLVSGHPLFVQAALEAVRRWRYSPTYLNGEPVEVISPILVTFALNR